MLEEIGVTKHLADDPAAAWVGKDYVKNEPHESAVVQQKNFFKAGASAEAVKIISGRAGIEIKPVEKDEKKR